ncbi:MAG: long-chain fatty acid--CoA ligase [Syntrophales bacterium LBB04]|nr:long-chain fatty acid--CoA ligase [Syntrophales bacterium LBB04]
MAVSLGQMFEESCHTFPDNVALIEDSNRVTYGALNKAVNSLGNRLKEAGLKKGDKIGLMLPNCPEFVIAYFAIQKIGAVAVTLNVLSTPYELRHLLGNSGARGLITLAMLSKKHEEIQDDIPLCKFLLLHDDQQPAHSLFRSAVEAGPFTLEMPEMKSDDPAVIIYTSGLTGKPVGAVLTQQNLVTQSDLLKVVCGTTDRDRGLALIPLFHSFGAVVNMLCAIRVGASMVLMDHFSVELIFSAIEKERITFIAAVPRLFLGMIMQAEEKKHDLSSLALCISGGAAMPPEYFPRFEEKFGIKIMEGYGLTEASPVCTFTRPALQHKPGSIGTPVPGVEARVVDDAGRDLPTGTVGELAIRGMNVMKGYYNDEAATAKVIRDGWLYTGDLAKMDADGYIFITGLKKRMIITSGFNVYPMEVEIVLNMHPAVKESLAVGKPDLLRGELVKALIVRRPDVPVEGKDIVRHCRKFLSAYKVPRDVEFVEKLN